MDGPGFARVLLKASGTNPFAATSCATRFNSSAFSLRGRRLSRISQLKKLKSLFSTKSAESFSWVFTKARFAIRSTNSSKSFLQIALKTCYHQHSSAPS